jgi:hypothetical protein
MDEYINKSRKIHDAEMDKMELEHVEKMRKLNETIGRQLKIVEATYITDIRNVMNVSKMQQEQTNNRKTMILTSQNAFNVFT